MRVGTPFVTSLQLLAVSAAAVPANNQGSQHYGTLATRDFRTIGELEKQLKSIWEQLQSLLGRPLGPAPVPPQNNPGQNTQPPAPGPPAPPPAGNPPGQGLPSSKPTAPAATASILSSAAPVTLSTSLSTESSSTPVTSLVITTSTNIAPTSVSSSSETSSSAASTTTVLLTSEVVPSASSIPSASAANRTNTTTATMSDCSALCSSISFNNDWTVTPISCVAHAAGTSVNTAQGQSSVGCATSFTPELDICQVSLNVKTSGSANTYMEVWLPNGNSSAWNGRTMSTDNGGLNGCVHYVDMQYVSGLGFAAIGDNGGHNSSSFDGSWTSNNNEAIIDWAWRARHASVDVGKQVVDSFYGRNASYSYYVGCSTGGQQGLHSAQHFPDDFDGIIAGSSAADFNHLEDWSGRFIQLTGVEGNDTFLTEDDWITVQSAIFAQCDEALDGVNDGILEDPTICQFDASVLTCNDTQTTGCLTATQTTTVEKVFTELYNADGELLYPALLYGSQVDAFRLGQLSGSVQGIVRDWFRGGVYNNSNFDPTTLGQQDYINADNLDNLHGNPSSFAGDLSAFRAAGKKLLMYHGMADPLVSGANSQRYYLKVAKEMGLGNTEIDDFMRLFRISGMAHCGVGGISGAGAWMFGQSGAAAIGTDNVIWNMVDWVEKNQAPETIVGTKYWYDTEADGIEFQRPHCRFPYRTTYNGNGDWQDADNWSCKFIDDWQQCGVGSHPRLCNVDGSFT